MKKSVAILALSLVFGLGFLIHRISAASPNLAKSNIATVEMQNGDKKNVPLRTGLIMEQMNVPEDLYSAIIEPGFPVNTYHSAGMYHAGQAINTLVADINNDWYQEIIVSGLANGPLYAFEPTPSA